MPGGLRISPPPVADEASARRLDSPLLRIEVRPRLVRGGYRPIARGHRAIEIALLNKVQQARLAGAPVAVPADARSLRFELATEPGTPIPFEVTTE